MAGSDVFFFEFAQPLHGTKLVRHHMDATKTPEEHHARLVDKVGVMLPMGGANVLVGGGLAVEVKYAGADGSGSHCRLVGQAGLGVGGVCDGHVGDGPTRQGPMMLAPSAGSGAGNVEWSG